MSTLFVIGATPIPGVRGYSGFDVPDDVKHLQLLGDGTTTHNEILQTTSLGMPRATLTGVTTDAAFIAAMESLRRSHASASFQDPETTRTVIVETFTRNRSTPASFLWSWSLALIEVA